MARQQPYTLNLLAVLLGGDMHGYGIYKQMIQDARSSLIISERTVYRELPRLEKRGFIEAVNPAIKPQKYHLTKSGRRWLGIERDRLQQLVRILNERL